MRILSWNIMRGGAEPINVNGEPRLRQILDVCADLEPDVLLLQEACAFLENGGEQAARAADTLQMSGHLGVARTGYHVAVFARQPSAGWALNLDLFHSAVAISTTQSPVDHISIVSVHLCPHDAAIRLEEAQRIVSAGPGANTLIMGDLNSPDSENRESVQTLAPQLRARYLNDQGELDTSVHRCFQAAGFRDCAAMLNASRPTFPTGIDGSQDYNPMRLDYAYASRTLAPHVASFDIIDDGIAKQLSDHFPILVTLE